MKLQIQLHRYLELWLWMAVILLLLAVLLGGARQHSGGAEHRGASSPQEALIVSPCEGFFSVSEYHGGDPLVAVGDIVFEDTIVAYVQSIDRTAVTAGVAGTIVEVMLLDMTPVATGDSLFRVELEQ